MARGIRYRSEPGRRFEGQRTARLAIVRTAAVLGHAFGEALKPLGITPTQYEVLRMLRGARAGGLSRNEIRDRLVTPVPDVTRLLDRMERARLIERERSTRDRRVVATRITSRGLDLLRSIDRVVGDIHRKQLGHLTARQLETLTDLLALARAGGTGWLRTGPRPATPWRPRAIGCRARSGSGR